MAKKFARNALIDTLEVLVRFGRVTRTCEIVEMSGYCYDTIICVLRELNIMNLARRMAPGWWDITERGRIAWSIEQGCIA